LGDDDGDEAEDGVVGVFADYDAHGADGHGDDIDDEEDVRDSVGYCASITVSHKFCKCGLEGPESTYCACNRGDTGVGRSTG
jgi:hypothetical protein